MKSNLSVFSLVLVVLILTSTPGCKHQDSEWQGTIEVVDGVTDVMNPKKPIYCENVTVESTFLQSIEPSVEQLFKEHEWTISDKINAYSVYLPPDLLHDAGEFPVKIYWGYNLELSKYIGLDFREFLGQEISVEIYKLNERLPDFLSPLLRGRRCCPEE